MNILQAINNNPIIKKILIIFTDFFLIIISFWIAFALRLGELYWIPDESYHGEYILVILIAYILYYFLAISFGLYNIVLRYVDLNNIYLITKIMFIFSVLLGIFITYLSIPGFPRSIIIIYPIILALLIYLSRQTIQSIAIYVLFDNEFLSRNFKKKKIAIYGAGSSGTQLARAIIQSHKYKILYFIDDDKEKIGRNIFGITIINFEKFMSKFNRDISEVHLALPRINKRERTEILKKLSLLNIRIRTLPPIDDLLKGETNSFQVQSLDIEDLLDRNTTDLNEEILDKIFINRVILITGAGGSIGSELCRQVLIKKPKVLVLFDVSEYAIYKIQQEIESNSVNVAGVRIVYQIGSIQDLSAIDNVINEWKPNIIYHAAAYKHVPIVEDNAKEGFKNNVLGTMNLALSAVKHKVGDFVLISTDKAVRPTNIMGYTKRLAELILQGIVNEKFIEIKDARESKKYKQETNFSIVRFGNVFESSGSAVTLFRKQIREGGPITITHKNVTRYFMTTREAAQLVILSGAFKNEFDPAIVYLLDMGEPIKIIDLAKKMVIQNGLTIKNEENENGDIEIKIIGLRPGEKILEELLISGKPKKTKYQKIFKSVEPYKRWVDVLRAVEEIDHLGDKEANIKLLIKDIID